MFRVEFLIALFSAVVLLPPNNCNSDGIFVKTDHSFERITQNDMVSSLDSSSKPIPDYISVTQTLLDMLIQDNTSVKAKDLEKFNLGLHQFFLSLAYELSYRRSAIQYPKLEFDDPVSLPDASALGKSDLSFYNVQVYGFPGFRKSSSRMEIEQGDLHLQYYKTLRTFSSDVMILTGHFNVYQDNFFFTYYIRNNTLESTQTKWRSNEGTIVPKRIEESLHFELEHLSHTYENSLKNSSIVNAILDEELTSIIEQIWLPKLISSMNDKLYPESVRNDGEFADIYRHKVLESLVESAKKYIRLTSPSDTFEASSINSTAISRSSMTFSLKYENQKVEGVLNFDQYYMNETKINDYLANTSTVWETVSFQYSNRSPAFVKFSIVNHAGKVDQMKYQIERINITCAYNVITDELPFRVSRKKDAFRNGSGFLIVFDLVNFDPVFEFVVRHIGNDMAKSIATWSSNKKYKINVVMKSQRPSDTILYYCRSYVHCSET